MSKELDCKWSGWDSNKLSYVMPQLQKLHSQEVLELLSDNPVLSIPKSVLSIYRCFWGLKFATVRIG